MNEDKLLSIDQAKGKDFTGLQLMDMESGKMVATINNVEFHLTDKPFDLEDVEKMTNELRDLNVEWSAEVKLTHKQTRQMKKTFREMMGHKPRLPRKKKKALMKGVRKSVDDLCKAFLTWPDVKPMIDDIEQKLFEAAQIPPIASLPECDTSGNVLKLTVD